VLTSTPPLRLYCLAQHKQEGLLVTYGSVVALDALCICAAAAHPLVYAYRLHCFCAAKIAAAAAAAAAASTAAAVPAAVAMHTACLLLLQKGRQGIGLCSYSCT
jgi:hypothetical protein